MILDETYQILSTMIDDVPAIQKIILNSGFTGVILDNDSMGIAMNIRSGLNTEKAAADFLQTLIHKKSLAAADEILKGIRKEKSSGAQTYLVHSVLVALYNALSQKFINESCLSPLGCRTIIGADKSPSDDVTNGETVTIVGFGGMVRPITKVAGQTFITELEPDLFSSTIISERGIEKGPDCCTIVPSESDKDYFKKSGTVFVTGCSLVTGTMDSILDHCRGKNIIVYGATAGFIPQPLLKRGVKKIRTLRITDTRLMAELLINCAGTVERFFPMASETVLISYP